MPSLLQRLVGASYFTPLTPEQRQIAEAAQAHAYNQQGVITSGMCSIGQLLYMAGESTEGLEAQHLRNIGMLIADLSVQLEHLSDVGLSMENYLNPGRLGDVTGKGAKK